MKQKLSEIVVLKPTTVFLSFLASQLPEHQVPQWSSLQTDCTAYSFLQQQNNNAMIDEVEKHFSKMFRHEICRWLGAEARNPITKNFLDFLCCFKLEWHSHLIVLEPSLEQGHQLIELRPRSALLQWMKTMVEDDEELTDVLTNVNLATLSENATVVVKNFPQLAAIKPFLQDHYAAIFTAAMRRFSSDSSTWPKIDSYSSFCRYFTVIIHRQLIHTHC